LINQFQAKESIMENGKTICVLCAWRQACNKKFVMDGATTTRCAEYTRDITLKEPVKETPEDRKEK
jgi:hypothetical protein